MHTVSLLLYAFPTMSNECDKQIYSIRQGYVRSAIDFTAMLSYKLIECPNGRRLSILRLFTVS